MTGGAGPPPARSLILGRIRDALGERATTAAQDYASIRREYRQEGGRDAAVLADLLEDRLQHYQVGVRRSARDAIRDGAAEILAARNRRRIVVPSGVPREWLPASLDALEDDGLRYADLDRSDGVLTACSLAIAGTGTIVLLHTAAEGRRALTLVPDYHLCVVFSDQIVETVPAAMRRIAALGPRLVTTISGPSATADIEMTRVRGVHGPRTMDVLLVG